MPNATIEAIVRLRRLPVFADYTPDPDLPQFRKHNLIYGFNGCGKTTLSRVFGCLAQRSRHRAWAPDCEYIVKMTDGTEIAPGSEVSSLSGRVLVFNDDFIEDNLRWRDSEASPIFLYLGPEAKDQAEQLAAAEAEKSRIERRLENISKKLQSGEREFKTHKTNRARLIANAIGQEREYNAVRLARDFDDYRYNEKDLLDESDLKVQQDILKQDAPLPKCDQIDNKLPSLRTLVHATRALLEKTLGGISLKVLRDHDRMLPWVQAGLDYHKKQHLDSCLLCGNVLTEDRTSDLEAAIGEEFEQFLSDMSGAQQGVKELLASLADLKASLPTKHDIVSDQRVAFVDATNALIESTKTGADHLIAAAKLLEEKDKSPTVAIAPEGLATDESASQWEAEFAKHLDKLNNIIAVHNKAHDEFQQNRNAAKDKIKKHYLADGHAEYRRLETRVRRATKVKERWRERWDAINSDIDGIKQQMRQHGPAAEQVNAMIKRYLGHGELELAAKEEGYEIRRGGQSANAPPSEGEKTAIALCYFLVLLESDGRMREDLIVILDDPISSMDTRSMNYACSMIRSLKNVGQLIVLTHNMHVMNEIKKWLKWRAKNDVEINRTNRGETTGSLFFIDTIQPSGTESRQSRIVEMPKHLREYEAEYHYLFNMMLRFMKYDKDKANYFFVMPNAIRKILEVFLAFKLPGSVGLSSKVSAIAQVAEKYGLDKDRLHALERLAHVESHSDSLDDLVTMSSMTVEETEIAANALLELMEKMDAEHKERMCRLCAA